MDSSNLTPKRKLAIAGVLLFSGMLLHYCYDKIDVNKNLRDHPVKVITNDAYNLDNATYYARKNGYTPGRGNFQFTTTFEALQIQRQQESCCCYNRYEDLDYIQSLFEYYLDDPHDEVRFPPEFFEVNRD